VVTGGSLQNIGVGTIGQKLFNTTDAPGTLKYTVSPISGASGNCAGEPFTVNVFVNPNASSTCGCGTSFSI
jgi:hypothetical protein